MTTPHYRCAISVMAAACVAACSPSANSDGSAEEVERFCTLVGCDSDLILELGPDIDRAYRIIVQDRSADPSR